MDDMNIDIERVKEIKEELDSLNENDVLFIEEYGQQRYALMPIELYEQLEDVMVMLNSAPRTAVKIAGPEVDLTYDEYEMIKKQIMDAVEKTFMPKPEKLN